jgi:hypothetical protein
MAMSVSDVSCGAEAACGCQCQCQCQCQCPMPNAKCCRGPHRRHPQTIRPQCDGGMPSVPSQPRRRLLAGIFLAPTPLRPRQELYRSALQYLAAPHRPASRHCICTASQLAHSLTPKVSLAFGLAHPAHARSTPLRWIAYRAENVPLALTRLALCCLHYRLAVGSARHPLPSLNMTSPPWIYIPTDMRFQLHR